MTFQKVTEQAFNEHCSKYAKTASSGVNSGVWFVYDTSNPTLTGSGENIIGRVGVDGYEIVPIDDTLTEGE